MIVVSDSARDTSLILDRLTGLIESSSQIERLRAKTLIMLHRVFSSFNYFGISRVFSTVNSAFHPQGKTVIRGERYSFGYPSGDYYWDRLLDNNWRYEPEIERFVLAASHLDFTFFDLGANFGFWSTRVAQQEFGQHEVVAVEASSESLAILKANLSGSTGPSTIFHRVVDSNSNTQRRIYGRRHAGRSIVAGWDGETSPVESVETVSVDRLFEEVGVFVKATKTICKIDIEGAELNALQGAFRAVETDVVFILEETGDLASSSTLAYASQVLELRLFVLSENGIVSIQEWPSTRKHRNVFSALQSAGVNIVATKSPLWLSLIEKGKI